MKFVRTSVELNDSFGYNDVFGRPPILLQVTMTGALDAEDGCRTKKFLTDDALTKVLFFAAYAIIFALSLSANLLVIWVVVRFKHLQNAMNLFIANLAVSDLVVACTSLWLTPLYTYRGRWDLGPLICTSLPFFQGVSTFVSSLTLMAIALDRYFVICHRSNNVPSRSRDHMSMRTFILLVGLIWSVSLLFVTPYSFHMRLAYVFEPCNFFLCFELWENHENLKPMFGIAVLLLQLVFPFGIIGVSYTRIWVFLHCRKSLVTERESSPVIKRRRRLLRLLITMVVLFAFFLLPFTTLNLLRDFGFRENMKQYFSFLFLLFHLMSMVGTAVNPILYAWNNQAFRQAVKCFLKFLTTQFVFVLPFMGKLCAQELGFTIENGNYSMALRSRKSTYHRRCSRRIKTPKKKSKSRIRRRSWNNMDQLSNFTFRRASASKFKEFVESKQRTRSMSAFDRLKRPNELMNGKPAISAPISPAELSCCETNQLVVERPMTSTPSDGFQTVVFSASHSDSVVFV